MEEPLTKVNQLFVASKNDPEELSKLLDTYLVPSTKEKRSLAEISTPYALRKEMLDKIPSEFWSCPRTVLEPCSGKGGFLLDIVNRFMKGLVDTYPNPKERHRFIVEKCLYFSDINESNIVVNKLLLDPDNEYQLNYNVGDTLILDPFKKWGLEGFDAVIGNPPYNDNTGNKGKGHYVWDKFFNKAYDTWVLEKGYILYVHPSSWRQVDNKIFKKIKEKQLIYLEIHGVKDGTKTFNCSTRYDWYLLEMKKRYKTTVVKDQEGIINEINLEDWDFLPNMKYDEIKILINGDKKLDVNYYRTNYGADKKWVSTNKTEKFKYPVVYSINKGGILSLRYSSTTENGHYELSKFIFSNGAGNYVDTTGEYGLAQWAYCIYGGTEYLTKIKNVFDTEHFKKIVESIKIDSSTYNIKVMKLFRKDFWKEFI